MDSITALAEKPAARNGKVRHDLLLRLVPIGDIMPAPENDQVYRPVDPNDPDIQALAESIGKYGVKVPLVLTEDNYLLSGHRRLVASRLAGLETVPCMIEPICRWLRGRRQGPNTYHVTVNPEFVPLLAEYNRQREKSLDEKLREEIIAADPHEAYQSLLDFRRQSARIDVATMEIPAVKPGSRSARPRPRCWPLSARSSTSSNHTGLCRIGGFTTPS